MLLKFEKKNLEIHKLSWNSITWILKKLYSIYKPLLKTFQKSNSNWYLLSKTYKNSHSKTLTFIILNRFLCYPNSHLVPLQILSYWESTVVAPISSLCYVCMYVFSLLSIMQILFWNPLTLLTAKTSNTKQSVELLYSWVNIHHIFGPL